MSVSQASEKPEPLPCPFSHLLLALVAVAPAVITVPANLNIVLTAAVTVWVGSKRSVKDTPPEESMTRTVCTGLSVCKPDASPSVVHGDWCLRLPEKCSVTDVLRLLEAADEFPS